MICCPGWMLWITSCADRLDLDLLDEIPRDLEIHVRLQQRQPHLAQRFPHVGLGYLPEPAQVPKRVLELAA